MSAPNKPEEVGTAGALYASLSDARRPFLDRAIESAELTIPTLVPPHGHTSSTKFYTPFQSVGAWGVNNLASKLLLAQFPPNSPNFKLDIDQFTLEKLGAQPDKKAIVDSKLNKMERAVQRAIEGGAFRVSLFEGMKHLLVAGNALLYMPQSGGMRVFHLHNFVIQRAPMGDVLDIVVKESISRAVLTPAMEALLAEKEPVPGVDKPQETQASRTKTVDLYTHIKWASTKWDVYQEIRGIKVPGSVGDYPKDKSPWIPIRMTKIDGESYGRGYVEEYLGDLKSLEGLTQAIVEGSAAAAKLLFLVNPNGTTNADDLSGADNGDFVAGTAEDVTALQLNKYSDFRVALETANKMEERLSRAFMLNSAVQRNGERVTAEEIRFMAQELESALGGIYSILSQELQLPIVSRQMFVMQRARLLPTLPKGMVKPIIVTGLEALGRGNDLNKLDSFIAPILQIEEARARIKWDNYMTRRSTALGMDTEGLIVTEEEFVADQENKRMQAMVAQGIGPGVTALGGMAKQGMANGNQATAPAAG